MNLRPLPLALLPLLGGCAFIPDHRPPPVANPPVYCYETIGRPQCFDTPQVQMGDLINEQLPPIVLVRGPTAIITAPIDDHNDNTVPYPVTTVGMPASDDASITNPAAPVAIIGPSDDVPFTDAPLPVPLVPNTPSPVVLPQDAPLYTQGGGER